MAWHPFRVLVDSSENELKVSQDGSDYKLDVITKVRNAAGTIVSLATETTLAAISATLTAINTTTGIKKIVDPLPAGTNNIGDVDVASSALPTGAATEATLSSIDGKDFATQTTLVTLATDVVLQAVRDRIGEISATPTLNTVMDRLKEIEATLTNIEAEDFSTEATLSSVLTKLTEIDTVLDTIDGKVATEATLLSADGRLTTIDSVLDSIKDTDGIKKITEQLPAGTNEIGKVAQGTKAAGSGAWPQVLYDSSGNVVGVVLDGAAYRIQTDSKVAKGASALVTLDAIDTVTGQGRLKTTLYTPDGDAVTFGSVPPSPESIKNAFCLNGTSSSLLVDGSGTPVIFDYSADPTHDISLQEIAFVIVSNSVTFGSNYFGSASGPLTGGLKIEVTANGNTGTVALLKQNEDFVHFASPGGFSWVVSSKDMLSSVFVVGGGLKLKAGTSDNVRVTVQDDIDAAGTYFKCFVKGSLLE